MAYALSGRRVAILAADGVERVELEQPRQAVQDAGAEIELLSIHDGEIAARNEDLEDAGTFSVDKTVSAASVDGYDALLLPGGTVDPDNCGWTRTPSASCATSSPPASRSEICHGPWTLLEAGVLSGRQVTSFPSLRTDLRNAGAEPSAPGSSRSSPRGTTPHAPVRPREARLRGLVGDQSGRQAQLNGAVGPGAG